MKYKWVIAGSVVALIFSLILSWYKSDILIEPIDRSNDPYVFLLGAILILHFYYIISNLDDWLKKFKIDTRIFDKYYLGYIVIIGILIILGIIGSYIVDILLY